jgi:SNF2 family DNA or RNA helicase
LDEGHKIRNPSSKGNKEISKLEADIKWILSGTPMQNSEKDIISLAKWIDCESVDVDVIVEKMVLRRTQEEQAKLNPRLALPGLETVMVKLDFETEEERDFYEKVEDYYMNNRDNGGSDALEAMIRCRQAATHPLLLLESVTTKKKSSSKKRRRNWVVTEDDDDEVSFGYSKGLPTEMPRSTSKFTYLVGDILKNVTVNKEKCLVFCTWTNEMKMLQKELKACGVSSLIYDGSVSRDNKEAVIYNFKNTTIGVLIVQITCGNAGLNLQCATRVYITTPHWNPCVELQAIGRAYRKGQLNKVRCVRLAMKGTIEDRCSDIQVEKLDMICDAMSDESMMSRLGKSVVEQPQIQGAQVIINKVDESDCEDMPFV